MKLKAKILKVEISEDSRAIITVKLTDDSGFNWFKIYSYFTTQVIKLASFKSRIKTDVQKDLKATNQLKEIKKAIGQPFDIII